MRKNRLPMRRSELIFLVKLLVAAGLLWFLSVRYNLWTVLPTLTITQPAWLLTALVVLFCGQLCAAWRWYIIASAADVPLSPADTVRLSFVGVFFNATLPSVIGGDAVRVWEMARLGHSTTNSIATVAADRLSGLLGLVLLIIMTQPLLIGFADQSVVVAATLISLGAATAFVAGVRLGEWLRLGFLENNRLVILARRICVMLLPRGSEIGISLLSVLSQLSAPLTVFALARSFSFDASLSACLAFIPLVTLVTLLPIAIGGWGLREGAIIAAMAQVGMPAEQSLVLSIAFGISLVILGLPGGAFWFIRSRKERPTSDV
jgi:uncharacterized membrane protein YbhN (UPF0104 family)